MDTPAYVDIADLEEDRRIDLIGHAVIDHGKTVSFITDADPGKADRYIQKLKDKFPGIRILDRASGPVPNSVTVKVGPPVSGAEG